MYNECFKRYTHSKTLAKLEASRKLDDTFNRIEVDEVESENVEANGTKRRRLSTRLPDEFKVSVQKCVICGKSKCLGKTDLSAIGLVRAKALFEASRFFQDHVFVRTSTLGDAEAILNANLHYHATCFRNYELKYSRLRSCQSSTSSNDTTATDDSNASEACSHTSYDIDTVLSDTFEYLEPRLLLGEEFTLTEFRNIINRKYNVDVKKDRIKSSLIQYFDGSICFVYPKQKDKSIIFYFPSKKVKEGENREQNIVDDCVNILLESIKGINFDLQDKFCDNTDLQSAWENVKIPNPFLRFFSRFFGCKEDEISNDKSSFVDDSKTHKRIKLLRIKSLFQIICYIHNQGQMKTPFHCLLGTFVYKTTKSKNTISTLNRLGLSISYDQILRTRTSLAAYTIEISKNKFPLPSHFNTSNYVTAYFDNFDHNEATISGLESSHDTVVVVFQDHPGRNLNKKPNISETNVEKHSRAFTSLLNCQEIKNYNKKTNAFQLPPHFIMNEETNPVTADKYMRSLRLVAFTTRNWR